PTQVYTRLATSLLQLYHPHDRLSEPDSSPYFLCLFTLLPPPPTSTLFPYTTLFRSPEGPSNTRNSPMSRPSAEKASSTSKLTLRDRKSTRLNSSHVSISYAVFCLKKKKHV